MKLKRTTIENRLAALQRQLCVEDSRHDKKIDKINEKIRALTKHCSHRKRTFHDDPSGGNDSYYKCDICGHKW